MIPFQNTAVYCPLQSQQMIVVCTWSLCTLGRCGSSFGISHMMDFHEGLHRSTKETICTMTTRNTAQEDFKTMTYCCWSKKKKKSQGWNLRESLVFLQEAVIKTYVGLCLFILGGCYQVSDLLGLWTANVLMNVRGFITLFGIGLSSIDQVVLVSLSPCWRLPHHTHTRVHVHTCLFLLEALIK